jgi:hypothetical protein
MLTYLIIFLGIETSPYFAAFLIVILGIFLGRYFKLTICSVISLLTFAVSFYMIATFQEITKLIGVGDLFYSILLSVSMWSTVLVTNRNTPSFQNLVQKLKTSLR